MEKRLRLVAYLCLRNTLYYLLFSSYLLTYLLTYLEIFAGETIQKCNDWN